MAIQVGQNRRQSIEDHGLVAVTKEERQSLSTLKDKYLGKRIFILGNGPSLNRVDLHKLENEYTFCCNRVDLLYKRVNWKASFYTAVDWRVVPDTAHINNRLTGSIFFFPKRFQGILRGGDDVFWYHNRTFAEADILSLLKLDIPAACRLAVRF